MVNLIDGKKLSQELLQESAEKVAELSEGKRKPMLVVITVGDDEASKVYVRNKSKACEKCGIDFRNERFSEDISREEVVAKIKELNQDSTVDGLFVQLPVPKHLSGIEQEIDIKKDVDGFNIYNLGNTLYNSKENLKLEACTPYGVMYMLEKYKIDIQGRHVVVLGRSNIVGKPLIGMLLAKNATVTSCNSYTNNMNEITKTADILISAIGQTKLIDSSYLSEKTQVIIDVGMNRDENGKLCGDVDFQDVTKYWENSKEDKYITPVPGGVGPMTVASLIHNVVECYENNISLEDSIKNEIIEKEYDLECYKKAVEEYKKNPKTYTLEETKKELGV